MEKYWIIIILFSSFFLTFFISSIYSWIKAKKIIRGIRNKQEMCFTNFKVSVLGQDKRGGRASPFFKAPYIDLIFTKNEVYFLPNKYSIFLGFNSIPTDLHRRLYYFSYKKLSPSEIFITWEKNVSEDKQLIFDVRLKNDKELIDKLFAYMQEWEKK